MNLSKVDIELLLKQKINKKIEEELPKVAYSLKTQAEIVTPVDTGNLKASYMLPKVTQKQIVLRNVAEYAKYILIDGKSKQLPQGLLPVLKDYIKRLDLE